MNLNQENMRPSLNRILLYVKDVQTTCVLSTRDTSGSNASSNPMIELLS
ncbi:hypothetical protein AWB67_07207 [Caballeronia terrestris]|uniref:Uncharacterized protein n=1 Tax=Caballeronia terrestris TaxID=1226301 RepID=A0A158L0W0_9BURK|nr:hypothetical protein AWB67_07207 [Caballeronia terrestris]